jgi:ATP-dependent protease HslVU (ClpYQ) peptidase subunit
MSKLHLGEVTEMAQRVKTLEETEVLKAFAGTSEDSDIMIVEVDE